MTSITGLMSSRYGEVTIRSSTLGDHRFQRSESVASRGSSASTRTCTAVILLAVVMLSAYSTRSGACRIQVVDRDDHALLAHRMTLRHSSQFVAGACVVQMEQRDDAWRGGAEECTGGVNPGERRFQVVDVGNGATGSTTAIGPVQAGVLRRDRPGSLNTRFARFGNSARS